MPQINLEVNEQTKKEWEDYISKESEVNTKSALIRLAVSKYISDSSSSGDIEEIIDDLREENKKLKSELEQVHNKVRVIDDEVRRDQDTRSNIADEILAEIHLIKSRDNHPAELISDSEDGSLSDYREYLYTVDDVKGATDYEKSVCRKVLEYLAEEDIIYHLRYKGTDYYYRSEFSEMEVLTRI
jgi:hypothetical protein